MFTFLFLVSAALGLLIAVMGIFGTNDHNDRHRNRK